MARIFTREGQTGGTETFALHDKEIASMIGLFIRAGVPAHIIDKLVTKNDESLLPDECRTFSNKIKLILSVRMVQWAEEVQVPDAPKPDQPDHPRTYTPKLISKTITKDMRIKCADLAEFLSGTPSRLGCTMYTGTYSGQTAQVTSRN